MSKCADCGKAVDTGVVVCRECWEKITAAAGRHHECKIDCPLKKYNEQLAQLAEKDKEITRLKMERNDLAEWVECLCDVEVAEDPDAVR